jgi:hypothetical protein
MGRNLVMRLLHRMRPRTKVVSDFVGRKILGVQPGAGLESHDFDPGLGQREDGHAASRAEADHDDVRLSKIGRHRFGSSRTWES